MATSSSLNGAKNSGAIQALERAPISHSTRKMTMEAAPRQKAGLDRNFFILPAFSSLFLSGLESLQGLFVHGVVGLLDQLAEAFRGQHAVVARMRDVDAQHFLRLAWPGRHDGDAV